MKELNACLELRRKIKDLNERILTLKERIMSPRGQIISDMPRGGGRARTIDDYMAAVERLERRKAILEHELAVCWADAADILNKHNATQATFTMLYLRFYDGLRWKDCAKRMAELYPGAIWNENKCFRLYRKIMTKVHKKAV